MTTQTNVHQAINDIFDALSDNAQYALEGATDQECIKIVIKDLGEEYVKEHAKELLS